MKRLSVQLSDKEKQELKKIADKMERSLNDCIREAVRDWIEKNR